MVYHSRDVLRFAYDPPVKELEPTGLVPVLAIMNKAAINIGYRVCVNLSFLFSRADVGKLFL